MKKHEVFEKEINIIKNPKYKESLIKLLDLVPDYFYEVAASSTGKYHPEYTTGKGGLVRHTKAVFYIGREILSIEAVRSKYTEDEIDLMLISMLLHDCLKHGKTYNEYSKFEHPLLAASFVEENKGITSFNDKEIDFIKKAISSHMGEWNTNKYSDVVLPKPKTKYEVLVHMCDYLASRKFIEIDFSKIGE